MTRRILQNFCTWQSTTAGTGAFTVGAAVAADDAGAHDVPANAHVVDGATYRYYAQSPDGSETQLGLCTYHLASNTFTRVKVFGNSDGDTTEHNFTVAPIVDIFPQPGASVTAAAGDTLPSGTLMLFQQTSAPPGWTKQVAHNDKVLRVVSGAASYGGVLPFTNTFSYRTNDAVTLSISQIPSHNHSENEMSNGFDPSWTVNGGTTYGLGNEPVGSGFNGGSGSHAHTIDFRVQYVDLIIAAKN